MELYNASTTISTCRNHAPTGRRAIAVVTLLFLQLLSCGAPRHIPLFLLRSLLCHLLQVASLYRSFARSRIFARCRLFARCRIFALCRLATRPLHLVLVQLP